MKSRIIGFREQAGLTRITMHKDERTLQVIRLVLEELRFSPREYQQLLHATIEEFNDCSEWFTRDDLGILIFFGQNKVWIVMQQEHMSEVKQILSQYVEFA